MDVDAVTPLLGALSPAQFMRRFWQKKPLLVRQAWPGVTPPLTRAELFALVGRDDVESRLVVRRGGGSDGGSGGDNAGGWRVRQGPLTRRALPSVRQPRWTLLVQGLDLHLDAARAMLQPFRFVPEARFDDLMISWASPGGGVGPHVDAYDVFLLQVSGRRRWRVGRIRSQADAAFIEGLPLKILRRFEPQFDWLLEPGDMLYLPPMWAHDGVADGECMTCSVGFRSPDAVGLAAELMQRMADVDAPGPLYRDPAQAATGAPGALPPALTEFARRALMQRLGEPDAVERALGESLTEPKPRVSFEAAADADIAQGVQLDRRTRMLYDQRHVFVNGEAFVVAGRDARLMRQLADERALDARGCAALSAGAAKVVQAWLDDGWLTAWSARGCP